MRNWKSWPAALASPSTGSMPMVARKSCTLGLRSVLTGLGHPAGTAQEIDASLQQLQQVQETRQLPPLITADFGVGLDLAHHFEPHAPCEIHLEDGSRLNLKLDAERFCPG
jgi:4-alpha-glucanotransferase